MDDPRGFATIAPAVPGQVARFIDLWNLCNYAPGGDIVPEPVLQQHFAPAFACSAARTAMYWQCISSIL